MRVDPDLFRIPHHDFVPTVAGDVENGVAHIRVTAFRKPDNRSAPPFEHPTPGDVGIVDEVLDAVPLPVDGRHILPKGLGTQSW